MAGDDYTRFFKCSLILHQQIPQAECIKKCYKQAEPNLKIVVVMWDIRFPTYMGHSLKAEPHIHLFSENSERWARIGEQVICGSVYSYILGIRHYAPNKFSVLPNFWKRQILAKPVCESRFSRLLVNLCENAWEYYEYSVFAYSQPFLENCMCSSALRKGRTLSEEQISSYAYLVKESKIPFQMNAPTA